VEVLPGDQAGRLEQRADDLFGGTRVGRRLQHHEGAGAHVPGHGLAGAPHGGQVGTALVGQRGRHADHHGPRAVQDRLVSGRHEADGEQLFDLGVVDVVDVGDARLETGDDAGIPVEPADPQPGPAGLADQRKPDISQPDDHQIQRWLPSRYFR